VTATPTGRLDLPVHPVTAVLAVSRVDSSGDEVAVESSEWRADLDYRPARVWVSGCETHVVICQTGWTTTDIPMTLKEAIAYRVWGNLDGIPVADWMRAVDVRVRPYAVRGL